MLEVLNNYIIDQTGKRRASRRRFARMLAASLVFHVAFYAIVLKLDQWSFSRMLARTRPGGGEFELVKLADLAPPAERLPAVRRRPDSDDRVDLSRLRLELNDPDDTRLIARSPNPSRVKGPDPSGGVPNRPPEVSPRRQPPMINYIETSRSTQPSADQSSQIALAPSSATQPPLPQQQRPAAGPDKDAAGGRNTREDGRGGASELGLAVIQSQYVALVRSKIWKANERLMPRDWIEAMLTRKVSADFELQLIRPGRVASLRLVRSSGYSTLDNMARQAINTASPFEGFPQEAGDALTLTVTVYYTPSR